MYKYDLEEIRRRVPLRVVAEEAGASFKDANHLASHCPLPRHAGDRSSLAFTLFDHERRWKCHSSCPSDANGGDVIRFYMVWKGVDFKTALEQLADRAGLTGAPTPQAPHSIPPPALLLVPKSIDPGSVWRAKAERFAAYAQDNLNNSETGAGARAYLEQERGLWPETWQAFHLGYNPRNWYDNPAHWGLQGNQIWLPRGIVIPGLCEGQPWYIKVRRPQPGQTLGEFIGHWRKEDSLPKLKFSGPRGGTTILFGQQNFARLPVLLLVEGEWDAMLTWQWCQDLCDVSTLGGAKSRFDVLDLALLVRYQTVLVVHDSDAAGDGGREYIANLHQQAQRVRPIPPPEINGEPAHDLTDFWKAGGNLRAWVAGHVADALEEALGQVSAYQQSYTVERWRRIAAWARCETGFRLPDKPDICCGGSGTS